MRAEYLALVRLSTSEDYKVLEAIWMHHITVMEKKCDIAGQKGNDSSWRYWVGQLKGAKTIMTAMQAAILDMEAKEEGLAEEAKYESLLQEIKGERK